MGTYLNPGVDGFCKAINSEIYVDKTALISCLNKVVDTEQRYVCISRPRRFGKSITVNMLCAYYGASDENRGIFEYRELGKTDNWDKYLGKFNVVKLVMTSFMKKKGIRLSISDMLLYMQELVCREIVEQFNNIDYFDQSDLIQVMETIYQKEHVSFVVVIDEWDAVFREYKEDHDGQKLYLDFLRDWLKDKNYISLAYMTGILPIKKYGKHSALNMFDEYSMISPLQFARYTGFTEDEVKKLCDKYGRNFDEIKKWYDGYEVSDIIEPDPDYEKQSSGNLPQAVKWSLYSPLSVVKAVQSGINQNYWNKTETYAALSEYIARNYDGLREDIAILMDGNYLPIHTGSYQNDMTTFNSKDDILTLLIHLGYLGYDLDNKTVFIPNNEVLDEFKASTQNNDWSYLFKVLDNSMKLLKATWAEDEVLVASLIEAAHDKTGNKTYNSEAALSYAIQLAYYSAQNYYTLIQELDTGKGYADLVYIPSPDYPDKPVLLIELKYEQYATTAIDQIKEKNYPANLEHYKGNIIMVGINYDKDVSSINTAYKHHSCKIERA